MNETVTPWSSADLLPSRAETFGWEIWNNGAREHHDLVRVRRALSNWQPQALLLVAQPGVSQFVSPSAVPELAAMAMEQLRRRTQRIALLLFVSTITVLVASALWRSPALQAGAFGLTCLLTMQMFELFGPMRSGAAMDERVRFVYWFRRAPITRVYAGVWLALLVSVAALQLAVTVHYGDQESPFALYGTVYPRVAAGEWWRLLTGAALHYSALHYLNNFFLLVLIGTLAGALLGAPTTLGTFLLGCTAGALGQMSLGGSAFDSCGGLSFGIYALFGLAVTTARTSLIRLPEGFTTSLTLLAVLGIGCNELGSSVGATAGHIVGAATGAIAGGVFGIVKRSLRPSSSD